MLKSSTIREMSDAELAEKLDAEASALNRLRLNHAISPADNPLKLRTARKDIARLKTELNARTSKKN